LGLLLPRPLSKVKKNSANVFGYQVEVICKVLI